MASLEDMIKEDETTEKKDEVKTQSGDGILNKIWNAESPNKKPAEYSSHALNWDNKESTGRIIRGFEGLIGNLDRAFIDVLVGTFQKIGELFSKGETRE